MFDHNSLTDCAGESVKTSSDSEDGNRSGELKKDNVTFANFEKMQMFEFPKVILWQFSKKIKKFLSLFSVSFIETFLLLDRV